MTQKLKTAACILKISEWLMQELLIPLWRYIMLPIVNYWGSLTTSLVSFYAIVCCIGLCIIENPLFWHMSLIGTWYATFRYLSPLKNRFIYSRSVARYRRPWASYQIHNNTGAHAYAPGMPGTFPRHQLQRKPLVSDPVCITARASHVPWCMSGSLTRGGGENAPCIPGACATRNFAYLVRGPWHYT